MKRILFLYLLTIITNVPASAHETFQSAFKITPDRVWIGPEYWANRLHDWRIKDGRLECLATQPRLAMRTVHLLTHRMSEKVGKTLINVNLGLMNAPNVTVRPSSEAGFLLGVGDPKTDYRSTALVQRVAGPGGGLFVGISAKGEVFFRDNTKANRPILGKKGKAGGPPRNVLLTVALTPESRTETTLFLSALDAKTDDVLSETKLTIATTRLAGGFALVSHPGNAQPAKTSPGHFWFRKWLVSGHQLIVNEKQAFGPILCAQHTLSRNVLKLTAQLPPIGEKDSQSVELQVMKNGTWKSIATSKIITPGFTAPFRIPEWDSTKDTPYRVTYDLKTTDGKSKTHEWTGTIRKDPVEKETIVVAGFTGNHNNSHRIRRAPFNWTTDVWFPHRDITAKVSMHKPDVLFFSGDQVYEGNSPSFPDRANIKLDYLYKWYLWCWAYRDLTKDIPSVCVPDDHDVYQGNVWGENGRKAKQDHFGGYVHPADFVKMVDRTQTSHLPDPYDPTPIEQGIGVYYTGMTYGRISFAILEDRKFKSGCARKEMPDTGTARPDHVGKKDFDPKTVDLPGLKLLGDRQLKFLKEWGTDWRGADMKIAMSQTIFAGMATHHGGNLAFLLADLDSNGWPQTGRNKALDALRKCFAFHLGGDQHLATIVHHGIDDHRDAIWSFCVPSVANFYPRKWDPKVEGKNRPKGSPTWMGDHVDGLGNKVTVYATTNPGKTTGHKPTDLHDKMPGYGIVKLNKTKRTITMECWPRFADPGDPKAKPYEGWPMTIKQQDNYARKAVGYLPMIQVEGMKNPVVQVVNEKESETVYSLRISGQSYRPKVFGKGTYTVKVGELGTDRVKVFPGVKVVPDGSKEVLKVSFR